MHFYYLLLYTGVTTSFIQFLVSYLVCLSLTAHDDDEQHQELCVPSVWASPEFAWLAWATSSHPLWGPPLQLCCLWRTFHRHPQLQQVWPHLRSLIEGAFFSKWIDRRYVNLLSFVRRQVIFCSRFFVYLQEMRWLKYITKLFTFCLVKWFHSFWVK